MLEDIASLKLHLKPAEPKSKDTWKMHEQGWVKVNVDAAFDAGNCTGRAEVVIRDNDDLVLAATARWLDSVTDVLTAEALAAKEGLELTIECGYEKVILEVHCRGLKMTLEASDGMRSSIGGLCADITVLGRSFVDFKVVWVSRDANSVAHNCDCMVLATDHSLFWIDAIQE